MVLRSKVPLSDSSDSTGKRWGAIWSAPGLERLFCDIIWFGADKADCGCCWGCGCDDGCCCGWCIVGGAPLTPFAMGGRPVAEREKSDAPSGLALVHELVLVVVFFGCGFLRRACEFDQGAVSPPTDMGLLFPFPLVLALAVVLLGLPLVGAVETEPVEVTVEVDEVDEEDAVDAIDDEELDRCKDFRDMNMFILLSSGFIEFSDWSPFIHPGRLRFAKLGGFATAVIETSGVVDGALGEMERSGYLLPAVGAGCWDGRTVLSLSRCRVSLV